MSSCAVQQHTQPAPLPARPPLRPQDFPYATVDLPHAVHKVSPGLSSFAFDAKAGAKSLWPLLKFAKDKVRKGEGGAKLRAAAHATGTAAFMGGTCRQRGWRPGAGGRRGGARGAYRRQRAPTRNNGTPRETHRRDGPAACRLPRALQVPEQQWERTPLQLFATSGLRMLADDAAARLVQECRRSLGGSGFLFRDDWARIISGQEEGLFGWVAINYATGALQVGGLGGWAGGEGIRGCGRREGGGGAASGRPGARRAARMRLRPAAV